MYTYQWRGGAGGHAYCCVRCTVCTLVQEEMNNNVGSSSVHTVDMLGDNTDLLSSIMNMKLASPTASADAQHVHDTHLKILLTRFAGTCVCVRKLCTSVFAGEGQGQR